MGPRIACEILGGASSAPASKMQAILRVFRNTGVNTLAVSTRPFHLNLELRVPFNSSSGSYRPAKYP
jgi:hypothetical protein